MERRNARRPSPPTSRRTRHRRHNHRRRDRRPARPNADPSKRQRNARRQRAFVHRHGHRGRRTAYPPTKARTALRRSGARQETRSRLAPPPPASLAQTLADAPIASASSPQEKIALFRRLFAGRTDVFPLRWENGKTGRSGYAPACANEWVPNVCRKPQVKCGACPNQAFINVSDKIIESHLRGMSPTRSRPADFVMGVYPLLPDDSCWFLAADFDEGEWAADALAYMQTCRAEGIPAALERSRSGAGGHVWIFFSEKVQARDARQLGAALLTETMERRPEIRFASYDRFFPNQDIMPNGGFGNLIALPLQHRAKANGNSLFVDDNLQPYKDQWAFLSTLPRMSPEALSTFVRRAELRDRVTAVRMPIEEDNADQPWLLSPSRHDIAGPDHRPAAAIRTTFA